MKIAQEFMCGASPFGLPPRFGAASRAEARLQAESLTPRIVSIVVLLCLSSVALAQSRLTGTVADPGNRAVSRARIILRNTGTGAQYQTTSNARGEYTVPSLPSGSYELSATAPGFSRYMLEGIELPANQSTRLDIFLERGFMAGIPGSTYEAPLLRAEAADLSLSVTVDRVDSVPFVRRHVRNPLDFAAVAPGVTGTAGEAGASTLSVNGYPSTTYKVIVDGQDITSYVDPSRTLEQQPSVDALSEFMFQTGNTAAEFGQSAGGLFNLTTRSGGNQYRGSVSAYFRNEWLNAGRPFTDNGSGSHLRPPSRDVDAIGNIGGPFIVPRIYNGRDRTFFYLNAERFSARANTWGSYTTVPTIDYRRGDFSAALGRKLGTDILGRNILENMIYDPATNRMENGQIVRDPFPGNRIDLPRFDPVATRIQNFIPLPSSGRLNADGSPMLVNNLEVRYRRREDRDIPSIKIDHSIAEDARVSFYYSVYSYRGLVKQDGLPSPITGTGNRDLVAQTFRLSGDYTVTPTLLARAVFSYVRSADHEAAVQSVLNYPAADPVRGVGLAGGLSLGMPQIAIGLGSANRGGMSSRIGVGNRVRQYADKPAIAGQLTSMRGNHTLRAGAEVRQDIWAPRDESETASNWTFDAAQTALPYLQTTSVGGGSTGLGYASFLLGRAERAGVSNPRDPRFVKMTLAAYVQDTWKAARKLTLNYGVRWDSQQAAQEEHFRMSMFTPAIPNPSAGGLPGAMVFEGFGPGRCNCSFTRTYPFAIGPRLGLAYQFSSLTLLRAGWGVSYGNPNNYNDLSGGIGFGWNALEWTSTAFAEPGATLSGGLHYDPAGLYEVNANAGLRPQPGQVNSPPDYLDKNGGRPPRINQWNISVQRELPLEILTEVAYVGNRAVWVQANSLLNWNGLTPERLASFGLDVNNAGDRALLASPLNSPLAQVRGFNRVPYAGFPQTLTVAQSLRPYPQFGDIRVRWAPLGNTWYDALQAKFTKRFRQGVSWTAAFTWQKELTLGVTDESGDFGPVNDVYNRPKQKTLAPQSRPFVFVTTFTYQSPRIGRYAFLRDLIGGWFVGGLLRYQSGPLLLAPASQNNLDLLLFRGTYMNRVAGQPLYSTNVNGKIDPNQSFLLNPGAWSDPGAGAWGQSAVYFNDYRGRRRPEENLSFGRVFRLTETVSIEGRLEMFNVFNRLILPGPTSSNALAQQARDASGKPVSGFGYIDTTGAPSGERTGQFLLRVRF